jgi:hypothetical protein
MIRENYFKTLKSNFMSPTSFIVRRKEWRRPTRRQQKRQLLVTFMAHAKTKNKPAPLTLSMKHAALNFLRKIMLTRGHA